MAQEVIQYPHIMITQSSAGSGKTYHLALRYLQTLLHTNCRINNILAITFTNKASMEMRNRILEWMKRILLNLPLNRNQPEILLIDIIRKDLNLYTLSRPEPLKLKAFENDSPGYILSQIQRNFEHLLKHYSDFKVSTIDSFNTFIIKSVCFKLGLDPEFEILLDHSRFMEFTLKELFQDIMDDPGTRNIFDEFVLLYFQIAPRELKWDSSSILNKIINFIWNKEMEKGKSLAERTGAIDLPELQEKIISGLKKVLHGLTVTETIRPNNTFLKALQAVFISNPFMPEKLMNWINKEFQHAGQGSSLLNKGSALPDRETIELYGSVRSLLSQYYTEKAGQKVSSVIKVYRKFIEKLDKICRRNRVVLISELNTLLRKVLFDEEQIIPEIYYYLAERYNHFLIDEFQDTNTLQWSNLEFLIIEEFSRAGSLFLVGDEKQSIFRWRGGNSELVHTIIDHFRKGLYPVEYLYQLNLDENFRSDEEIVRFNNELFQYENLFNWVRENIKDLRDESLISPYLETYRNSGQKHVSTSKAKGYIYAEQLMYEEEDERKKEEITKEHFLSKIDEIIHKHKFHLKDIAVLTRTNAQANKAVKWLLEKEYQVESELTVSIKSHPLIIEIIQFLSFLNNLSDDMAFINFITGQIFTSISGLKQDEIFSWLHSILAPGKERAVYQSFREWQKELWTDSIEFFFKRSGYLPLYEFILILYKKWGLFQTFPDSIPYFLKFSEIIQDLNSESNASPSGLLHLWDETEVRDKTFLLKITENTDAIKVMTIHKSKGLQFPIVLVPFAGSQGEKDNLFVSETEGSDRLGMYYIDKTSTCFSDECYHIYYIEKVRDLIDEINDLYVALTRPEHALFIFFEPAKAKAENKLAKLLFKGNGINVIEKGRLGREASTGTGTDNSDLLNVDLVSSCVRSEGLDWLELIRTKVRSSSEISRNRFSAADSGTAVHYILSLIEHFNKDELGEKIRAGVMQFGLSAEYETIKAKLERAFSDPGFLHFFQVSKAQAEIFIEKEVVDSKGNLKRADRFIVYPDRIELIDFKTGEEYKDEHRQQILDYKYLLAALYPGKQFDCYLAYLDENKVIKI